MAALGVGGGGGGEGVFVCLPTGYVKTIITVVLPGSFDRLRGHSGNHNKKHIVL